MDSLRKTIKNLREDKKIFMNSPEGIAYKKRKQTYAKIEKIDQLEDKVKSIENKIDEVLTTLKKVL